MVNKISSNKLLVSVVIRTTGTRYKLKYLEKLLQSLANQTFRDYELVVASESNGQVVEELVRKIIHKNYRVIETNCGIRSSHGEYIILLDDDYILDNNYIEELLELIQNSHEKIACIGSNCIPIYKEDLKYRSFFAKILETLSLQGSLWRKKTYKLSEHFLLSIGYGGAHAICRRKAIFQAGLYDEELNEPLISDDLSLALKLYSKGYLNGIYSKVAAYHLEKYVSKTDRKAFEIL